MFTKNLSLPVTQKTIEDTLVEDNSVFKVKSELRGERDGTIFLCDLQRVLKNKSHSVPFLNTTASLLKARTSRSNNQSLFNLHL